MTEPIRNSKRFEDRTILLEKCKKIFFPVVNDVRGKLCFIEGLKHVPFDIKRVYFIFDVPSDATRGGHVHTITEQVVVALSGSFDVVLDDGYSQESVMLNRPYYGLYIPPGVWRSLENFSSNSVALSIVSTVFSEQDYVRDHRNFRKLVAEGHWK